MAECKITTGIDAPDCASKFLEPGIKKENIYLANKSEITLTKDANDVVTGWTFDQYKGFIQVTAHKDTALWSEELVVGQNSGSYYNQTFTFRTIENSNTTKEAIEDMVDVDLVVILHEKPGRFVLLGETGGITMTENTAGSGATGGDDTGNLVTFTGTNNGKHLIVLDTDEATTLTAIEADVIA